MAIVNVNNASGVVLDWLVAKAEGVDLWKSVFDGMFRVNDEEYDPSGNVYSPSSDWNQGGPIIERECLEILLHGKDDEKFVAQSWNEEYENGMLAYTGPTILIAAMRCYVASKFGEQVDVPDELLEGSN